jgi:hypothetical protein
MQEQTDELPKFIENGEGPPPPGYVPGKRIVIVIAVSLVAVLALNLWASFRNRDAADRDALASRVVDDPARVTVTWTPTADGLVEESVAIDGKTETVELIRRHVAKMREERANFGDFSTPAFEHRSLPGRDQLESLVPQMTITATDIDNGARLVFATPSADGKRELNRWADALRTERTGRTQPSA